MLKSDGSVKVYGLVKVNGYPKYGLIKKFKMDLMKVSRDKDPPKLLSIQFLLLIFFLSLGIVVVANLLTVLVTLETDSVPFVGTIEVVTSLFPETTSTSFTKISVTGVGYPVTAVF